MSCDRYQELLSARLDGELTEAEDAFLREHLGACPECREKARVMGDQDALLSRSRVPIQPSILRAKVAASVDSQRQTAGLERWHFGLSFRRSPASSNEHKSSPGPMIGPWGRA